MSAVFDPQKEQAAHGIQKRQGAILYKNISQLCTCAGGRHRGAAMADAGIIRGGAFVAEGGVFTDVGTQAELERRHPGIPAVDCGGKLVTPGYIDSHTHLVFAGERSAEFAMRLQGASYMEIMRRGGGIAATVQATRAASEEQLVAEALPVLADMLALGVTACEVKSGYGLDVQTELKQLRAVRALNKMQPVELIPTFLGAHAVPQGTDADRYIDYCCAESLPAAAESGLAEIADIFCEQGVFSLRQSERYLRRAAELGFACKLHADEMFPLGGAGLAAKLGAASADHLLKVKEEDIAALASSDTVATVLPLTAFCLGEAYAPARRLIDGGAALAVGSDYNPGSCRSYAAPLLLALCCIYMHMRVEEALVAFTANAAVACRREGRLGGIEAGKQADFLVYSCPSLEFLPYVTGVNLVKAVYKKGVQVYG